MTQNIGDHTPRYQTMTKRQLRDCYLDEAERRIRVIKRWCEVSKQLPAQKAIDTITFHLDMAEFYRNLILREAK